MNGTWVGQRFGWGPPLERARHWQLVVKLHKPVLKRFMIKFCMPIVLYQRATRGFIKSIFRILQTHSLKIGLVLRDRGSLPCYGVSWFSATRTNWFPKYVKHIRGLGGTAEWQSIRLQIGRSPIRTQVTPFDQIQKQQILVPERSQKRGSSCLGSCSPSGGPGDSQRENKVK